METQRRAARMAALLLSMPTRLNTAIGSAIEPPIRRRNKRLRRTPAGDFGRTTPKPAGLFPPSHQRI